MKTALQHAGVVATDVNYLEAHGTGTTVGDPIEIEAVSAVFCRDREADSPLVVGSVKTNFGHLESAAGIAGLIKAVLVVQRGMVPKHLHLQNLNPSIDWEQLPLQITTSLKELQQSNGQPRLAGVILLEYLEQMLTLSCRNTTHRERNLCETSSCRFALGGGSYSAFNYCETVACQTSNYGAIPSITLVRKSRNALRELAANYLDWLGEQAEEAIPAEPLLSDMSWSAGVGRNHFDHRAGIVFKDYAELEERLKALVKTTEDERVQKPVKVALFIPDRAANGPVWKGALSKRASCSGDSGPLRRGLSQ